MEKSGGVPPAGAGGEAVPGGVEGSLASGQETRGILTRVQFEQSLRSAFPALSDAQITLLIQLGAHELQLTEQDNLVEYRTLFMEDEEGKTGPFLEAVLEYLKKRRMDHVERVVKALLYPGYTLCIMHVVAF